MTLEQFLIRADSLIGRLEARIPAPPTPPDFKGAHAFVWRQGKLQAVLKPVNVALEDLQHVTVQKSALLQNTRQFVQGLPANNVLLTGALWYR